AREFFLCFVALSAEELAYARPVAQWEVSRGDLTAVCDLFLAEGIVVVSQQSPDGARMYELADPTLVKSWTRIVQWVMEDLPFRRWLRDFSARATAWQLRQGASFLLAGKTLEEASDWVERFPGRLTPQQSAFLEASQRAAQRRRWMAPLRNFARLPLYKQ